MYVVCTSIEPDILETDPQMRTAKVRQQVRQLHLWNQATLLALWNKEATEHNRVPQEKIKQLYTLKSKEPSWELFNIVFMVEELTWHRTAKLKPKSPKGMLETDQDSDEFRSVNCLYHDVGTRWSSIWLSLWKPASTALNSKCKVVLFHSWSLALVDSGLIFPVAPRTNPSNFRFWPKAEI